MKKRYIFGPILLYVIILLYRLLFVAVTYPGIDDMLPMIITSSENVMYMAANGQGNKGIFLYRIDENGCIENFAIVSKDKIDDFQRVIQLKEDADNNIYFLASGFDGSGKKILTVYRADSRLNTIENLSELSFDDISYNVTDMFISGTDVYITIVAGDKGSKDFFVRLIHVLPEPESEDELNYEIIAEIPDKLRDGDYVRDAVFDGKELYMIDSGDDLWKYSLEEETTTAIRELGKLTRLGSDYETMIFTKLFSEEDSVIDGKSAMTSVIYKNTVTGKETKITSNDIIVACDKYKDGFVIVKMNSKTNGFDLEFIDDNKRRVVEEFEFDGEMLISKEVVEALRLFIVCMLMIVTCTVIYRVLWKKKSLAVRVMSCVIVMNFLFSSIFSIIVALGNLMEKEVSRRQALWIYSAGMQQTLTGIKLDPINYSLPENYLSSTTKETLQKEIYTIFYHDLISERVYTTDIIYADDNISYVMESQYYGTGDSVANAYGREVKEFVDEYRNDRDKDYAILDIYGERNSVQIAQLTPEKTWETADNIYVLSYTDTSDMDIYFKASVRRYVIMELSYTAVTTLVLFILLFLFLHPIKSLCHYMAVVAGGMYDLPDRIYPDNEIGEMWIYLHALCSALKVRNVARSQVLDYYARFVPRGFERLFSVDELQDIQTGSVRNITGAMAVLESSQMAAKNGAHDSAGYSKYQSKLFSEVSGLAEKYNGITLANDGDLDVIRTIFSSIEDRSQKALGYSLDVLNSMEAEFANNNCILLLHEGKFSCGIIGDARQQFPYVISEDIEFLRQYLPKLKKAGVRTVVTEDMRKKLVYSETFRYIGYVSSRNGKRKFKLYEDLNPCEREVREAKMRLDDAMQDAMVDFYRGAVKEARDSFSKILKELPEDGIAAWYLFRCEEILVGKDDDNRKDLFCKERFTLLEE